jgi:tripeptidyl-peptidase-1
MMRSISFVLFLISTCIGARLIRQESSLDLSQWSQGQEADLDQLVEMTIALAVQNVDLGVETILRISNLASPDYGQHLSAHDVALLFEAKPDDVSEVTSWLKESGIDQDHVSLSHGGGYLSLQLSVREATLLLYTTFYHQKHKETGRMQISCYNYHIPDSLAASIDYILAVSPIPIHKQTARDQIVLTDGANAMAPLPFACFTSTTPECLRKLYNIPENVLPHPNNSFGIFEPSWFTWLPEDLDIFFKRLQPNSVGHRPAIDAINGGFRNLTGGNWYEEADLDFEYAMALTSPQEVTNVQVGDLHVGNLDNMLAAFDRYYCDPVNERYKDFPNFYPPGCNETACDCGTSSPPKVLSISWGYTEAGFSPNYIQRQCLEFLKLGLMGTSVVVSVSDHGTASDRGTYCIDDDTRNGTSGKFSPIFPATCPWVTSVGGTQMLPPNGLNQQIATDETAFRKLFGKYLVSSGGGFSNVFLAPPYQVPNVAAYKETEKDHLQKIQNRFNSTGRGYPDVAARADDYQIVMKGGWKLTSGTSASNPVFASIITLINSERMHAGKGSVGFINPVLYSNPDALNDVVTGANQGCGVDQAFRATRGWDAVTGMGSPDYERLRALFMSLP